MLNTAGQCALLKIREVGSGHWRRLGGHRLLVDVLDDQGSTGKLVGHDAFTGDELGGGQADVRSQTSQVASGGGTGQGADQGISTGHDGLS